MQFLKTLSAANEENTVQLFHDPKKGKVVLKKLSRNSSLKREVAAYKKIPRKLRPALYKINDRCCTLTLSYHPPFPLDADQDLLAGRFLKQLHESTRTFYGVFDPGTGQTAPSWKHFLKIQGESWLKLLQKAGESRIAFFNLLERVNEEPFAPLSLITCDPDPVHLGRRSNHTVWFDFDRSLIGNPLWDVSGYALLYARSETRFLKAYGALEERESIERLKPLFAMQEAAREIQKNNGKSSKKLRTCLAAIHDASI